ncbi:cyclin-J-like [Haliotis cracherodii]|uniref:cyclin-J-like n=1 Tax=Haliotis cracherodii TaxID=6455 RepID=UPI0039EAD1F5
MMDIEWWRNLIAADIYATLKQKEQELPVFHSQGFQLSARTYLVDWLSLVVEQLQLSSLTLHLAVFLLDFYMDSVDTDRYKLYLLAMTCLRVACKFEEHIDKLPRPSVLNSLLPKTVGISLGYDGYLLPDFLDMELSVLRFHNWRISAPTTAHFLPYFLTIAADEGDLHNGVPIVSKTVVLPYLEKHAKYFSEISLQDHTFRDYPPSLTAAACIAASRICLHLSPTWPKHMMLLTDYYLEELLPCMQLMLRYHQRDEANQVMTATAVVTPVVEYVAPTISTTYYNPHVIHPHPHPHPHWVAYNHHLHHVTTAHIHPLGQLALS